jgi:hypothetical protein
MVTSPDGKPWVGVMVRLGPVVTVVYGVRVTVAVRVIVAVPVIKARNTSKNTILPLCKGKKIISHTALRIEIHLSRKFWYMGKNTKYEFPPAGKFN